MSTLRRRLPLPASWASVRGLWLAAHGLDGIVLDEAVPKIIMFAGSRVVTADVLGWTVRQIIACLSTYVTPPNVEPQIALLTERDLQPLLACGALTRVDQHRIMAHVPGWQP